MQTRFLIVQKRFERFLSVSTQHRYDAEKVNRFLDERFVERNDDKHFLYVHLNHSLANERGTEERPERHQKMTARNAGQIEQWIWNLHTKKKVKLIDE